MNILRMLTFYNSLTQKKENFQPLKKDEVGLYSCGPTVYHYVHIGNLRTYVFVDILKRILKYNGYKVNHIMNITDVGHLTDDGDNGEDKMEKGARREGKTAWEIAEFFTDAFMEDIEKLSILEPSKWVKATEHIPEQIEMVDDLLEKGIAYETPDAIYFDTTKIDNYGELACLDCQNLQAGKRVEMGYKRNLHDFALWKFASKGEQRQMEWDSPYNSAAGKNGVKGFPGWHIECSAMSRKYLGDQFDIHCGGIDLKSVHHINEIAQTEAVTGKKPWVKFWMHGEFIVLDKGEKMSKSGDNFITLATLIEKGFEPLAYKYLLYQTHYRKELKFSFDALESANTALGKLRNLVAKQGKNGGDPLVMEEFKNLINDDLNMPEALALLWKGLKEKRITQDMVVSMDKVFGLELHKIEEKTREVPEEVQKLLEERKKAREDKDWVQSDVLREKIRLLGFNVKDTSEGQELK